MRSRFKPRLFSRFIIAAAIFIDLHNMVWQ